MGPKIPQVFRGLKQPRARSLTTSHSKEGDDIFTTTSYTLRHGSVHGDQHQDWHINNQDGALTVQYQTAAGKTYYLGLVTDGCTGITEFSHTEVGAHLALLYCVGQIQELTAYGVPVAEIPKALYPRLSQFLSRLSADIFPRKVTAWPYPFEFDGGQAFRNGLSPAERFEIDYLAATILGFIDDGETLVTFHAGDGVIIVNGEPHIISQDNQPKYVVLHPDAGFETKVYPSAAIRRLAIATDGLSKLLSQPSLDVANRLFTHQPDDDLGLRTLLLELLQNHSNLVGDDCSVATRERTEG